MAQLYKEHAETEEYVFSSLSSLSTATRSFLVSNGSQIINRANNNLFSTSIESKEYKLQKEAGQVKDENVFGVSSLPKIISVNDTKETFNAVIGRSRRLSSSDNVSSGKIIRTQQFGIFPDLNNTSLACAVLQMFDLCISCSWLCLELLLSW